MARNLSAEKRVRQSLKRNIKNRAYKSKIKTSFRKVLTAIEEDKSSNDVMAFYRDFVKMIDRYTTKGIYHKNTSARKKSNLYKKIKEAGKLA